LAEEPIHFSPRAIAKIGRGNTLTAIRFLREDSHTDLSTAKQAVDAHIVGKRDFSAHPIPAPEA